MPVISLSHQQEIALEVTVTNKNGDDAYESVLTASFPDSLSYAAVRPNNVVSLTSQVRSALLFTKSVAPCFFYLLTFNRMFVCTQISCQANLNGSKAECELGNPFKRDSKVSHRDCTDIFPSVINLF